MNKEDILAKPEAERTAEEVAFLAAEAAKEEESGEKSLDIEAVKAFLSKEGNSVMAKKMDEISKELVDRFVAGVSDNRKAAIETGKKEMKGQDKTRLFMKALLLGDKVAAKALSTTGEGGSLDDDAQAGLLIPVELRNEVIRVAEGNYGLARKDMMYLPFSGPGNSRIIPTLGTSVHVFWTGEGAKKKSTQPQFNLVTQVLRKLAAIVPMTEEILEDSTIDLNKLLGQLFAEAIAKEEDLQFFAGTGSPWTGILNDSTVNDISQASGDATQLTADDLLDMIDATPSGALNGAKFYMHRTVFSVVRKLKNGNGDYIVGGPIGGTPGNIWGYPYELSDAFPALGSVSTGEGYILFGNLKQGAIFGDKQQIRIKLLTEATVGDGEGNTSSESAINLAEQDMVALRIVERVGYVIAVPSALTVLKAAATES